MKETKFFLVFVIFFSFCASAQNRPGIDYFPHVGFFDFIVNYLRPPNGLSSSDKIAKITEDNGYYFDKLTELGLTNFVSDGQEHTSKLSITSPFLINDMGFSWKADSGIFNPSIYMNAIGHDKQKYALEFGGTPVGIIEPIAANYGFVRPGQNKTNYWSMTAGDLPLNIDSTGYDDDEEIGNATIYFRGVRTATDEPGAMVWGKLPPVQFPFANLNHIMKIRIRKLNAGGQNVEAIRIIISSTPLSEMNLKKFYSNVYKNGFKLDVNLAPLGLQQAVSDTAIHWINDYGWFKSEMFTLKKSEQLYFAILWPGDVDLNIDKIAIITQKYDEVFEIDSAATELFMDNIQSDIVSKYGSDPGSIIQDFYFDEPFLLTARYRSQLQQRIREAYSGNPTMHLNGATGNVPEYFHRFENEYARESTSQPVGNYLLYDMYPFSESDDIGQTTVQQRLSELVNWSAFGPAHEQYGYNYAGLRPALMAAHRYDTDTTNDVPLFMTLQVHAEHQVISGQYVPSAAGKRAPGRDEISAFWRGR